MRRKYGDCQRVDGNCSACSLVNYGRDCHNRSITKMEWCRLAAGLSQQELANKSGIGWKTIQRIELGDRTAEKIQAGTLIAIANVLGVHPKDLL